MMNALNKEAEAGNSEGIHKYSEGLIQGLVGTSAGPAYEKSVTDRLARAESMARKGNRKLIPEADIAQAFNQLMKETGALDSYKADVAIVEELRRDFAKALPSLITLKKNGIYCNPGEAVYILESLIQNVARPSTPIPKKTSEMHVGAGIAPVQEHLELFYVKHSQSKVTKVFNHLFKVFQI
jgi:hypothetical protein